MTSSYGDLVEEITRARFTPVRVHEGYDMHAVDDLLDRVVAALGRGEPIAPLLDDADLGHVRWREGYDLGEVDRFLAHLRERIDDQSTVHQVQVTFDCADPAALAGFWAVALGYLVQPPPPGFDTWDAALEAWGVPAEERNSRSAIVPPEGVSGPRVFFQRVPEGKTAKNRVHLDVRAAPGLEGARRMEALEAFGSRLVELGARRIGRFEPGQEMSAGHLVMTDPEGNEFCLD